LKKKLEHLLCPSDAYLLLVQQHHDFEEENVVHRHLLVLVQDLIGPAADDVLLD
jgi:hypothetical protein